MGCTPQTTRTTTNTVISNIIDTLRDTSSITSIVDNADGTATVTTSETLGLVVSTGDNPFVTIGGVSYQLVSLITDTSFIISFTGSVPSGSDWKADAPYFFYGDPIQMSNEIDKIAASNAKYPCIVMFDTGISSEELDELNPIEITESLELYFVDIANYKDWAIEDFYSNVIDTMYSLSMDFVQACRDYRFIEELSGQARRERVAKWGVTVVRNGKNSGDTIFNDNLSGVSLRMDLPISKSLNGDCC